MLVLPFSAVRKYIGPFGNWHVYAFAHLGYQVQAISILSSIFMTVVLALERYLAITKPIEYHNAIQGRSEDGILLSDEITCTVGFVNCLLRDTLTCLGCRVQGWYTNGTVREQRGYQNCVQYVCVFKVG